MWPLNRGSFKLYYEAPLVWARLKFLQPSFLMMLMHFHIFFVGGVATRQFFPYAVNDCLSAFAGVGWQLMKRLFNVELQD